MGWLSLMYCIWGPENMHQNMKGRGGTRQVKLLRVSRPMANFLSFQKFYCYAFSLQFPSPPNIQAVLKSCKPFPMSSIPFALLSLFNSSLKFVLPSLAQLCSKAWDLGFKINPKLIIFAKRPQYSSYKDFQRGLLAFLLHTVYRYLYASPVCPSCTNSNISQDTGQGNAPSSQRYQGAGQGKWIGNKIYWTNDVWVANVGFGENTYF